MGVSGHPICFGYGNHCLKMAAQAWLSMMRNATDRDRKRHLYLLNTYSFHNRSCAPNASVPFLPPCQVPVFEHLSEWVHWTSCRSETARVLANTSYGRVIDWSPLGSARVKRHGADLLWHRNNDTISTRGGGAIVWHGGGFSPPAPHLSGSPIQKDLWKLAVALQPNESLGQSNGKFLYHLYPLLF